MSSRCRRVTALKKITYHPINLTFQANYLFLTIFHRQVLLSEQKRYKSLARSYHCGCRRGLFWLRQKLQNSNDDQLWACNCSACGFAIFSSEIYRLYLVSVTKIKEITYAIYQGLFNRRLYKEYGGRKSKTCQGLICTEILPLHVLRPSPRSNNLTWACDPIKESVPSQRSTLNKNTHPLWLSNP